MYDFLFKALVEDLEKELGRALLLIWYKFINPEIQIIDFNLF